MPSYLSPDQHQRLRQTCALLVPAEDGVGALEAGADDYIDTLLSAFLYDPPRIWAGGPFSGRMGGDSSFASFQRLSQYDELAWRTRIEGSLGIPERERLGPVRGLQEWYSSGLDSLGPDFLALEEEEQFDRLRENPAFIDLVYRHVCEGMYGAPEYGGNRNLVGWKFVGYLGDVQPRGYSDAEVSGP